MRKVLTGAAALVALTIFATGASAETIRVTIKGMKFSPAEVSAKVGDTIEWSNEDKMPHTATANDKTFDVPVAAGTVGTLVVEKAGDFAYFCKIHPSMKAKLTAAE